MVMSTSVKLSFHSLLSCLPFLITVTALSPDSVQSGWSGSRRVLRALVSWEVRMNIRMEMLIT